MPTRAPLLGNDRLLGALLLALAGFLARELTTDTPASLWATTALLGLLLGVRRLRGAMLALTLALAAAWMLVAFSPLARRMSAGLVRRDPLAPADAVLVLGSRLQADGQPTAAALSRLVHGLELVRQGWAPHLVVTEGGEAGAHAAAAQALLTGLALPQEVIAIGPTGRTRDEAVQAASLGRARGWHRLLVVTSPTHSRRGCAALAREGLEVICSPAPETEFDLETLDRPAERLACFRSALHEWLGLWLYRQRGWI